jgi:hypothetical protein
MSSETSRYEYRVVARNEDGVFFPILYTNDDGVARHVVDTREPSQAAHVIDARGNVIYEAEHGQDDSSVDLGKSLDRL